MSQPVRMGTVGQVPVAQLEQYWRQDYDALVTSALALQCGELAADAADLLTGPVWFTSYMDALHYAVGELETSVEWMDYERDQRLPSTSRHLRRARTGLASAQARLRARHRAESHQHDRAYLRVEEVERRWLLRALHDQWAPVRTRALAQHGLAEQPPWGTTGRVAIKDALELAYAHHVYGTDPDDATVQLEEAPARAFRDTVANDARTKAMDQRQARLRHPHVMPRWGAALGELMRSTGELARATHGGTQLPAVSGTQLRALPVAQVEALMRQRRFLRSVHQRKAEWARVRQAEGVAAMHALLEAARPWREVEQRAALEFAAGHPSQLEVIQAAVRPHRDLTDPALVDQQWHRSTHRHELERQVCGLVEAMG